MKIHLIRDKLESFMLWVELLFFEIGVLMLKVLVIKVELRVLMRGGCIAVRQPVMV